MIGPHSSPLVHEPFFTAGNERFTSQCSTYLNLKSSVFGYNRSLHIDLYRGKLLERYKPSPMYARLWKSNWPRLNLIHNKNKLQKRCLCCGGFCHNQTVTLLHNILVLNDVNPLVSKTELKSCYLIYVKTAKITSQSISFINTSYYSK